MSELERYGQGSGLPMQYGAGGGGLDARRQNKQLAHVRRAVRNEVVVSKDKVDGVASLTEHSMHRLAEVDNTRRTLAGNDEGLNKAMIELEINFMRTVGRIQNELYRGM